MTNFYSIPKSRESSYKLSTLYVAKFASIMGSHGYGIFYLHPEGGLYKFKRVTTGKFYSEFSNFSDSVVSDLVPLENYFNDKEFPDVLTKKEVAVLEKQVQKNFKVQGGRE